MAKAKKGLTLEQMQMLVRDADQRMQPLYEFWRFLEGLARTGAQRPLNAADLQPWVPKVSPNLLDRVNMVLGHIEIMVANSVSRDPSLIVEAIGTGSFSMSIADDGTLLGDDDLELNAKFAQAVLAYFWKRGRVTETLHDATEDLVKLGNGFLTAGWAFVATSQRRDDHAEVLEAIDAAAAEAKAAGEDDVLPDLEELAGHFPLTQEMVATDEPFTEYVSPYDILVPVTARRMATTPWVARRLVLPVEELVECEDFKNTDTITPNASALSGPSAAQADRAEADRSGVFQYATVYQFWNMKERRLVIFQVDAPEALFDGPIPYLMRRPPFVHLRNHNDGGNTFWAFGDLENLVGPQLMLNTVIKTRFQDLLRSGNKYFMLKKLMTPEVRRALASPDPDVIIPLDLPPNMTLDEALRPVQRLAATGDAANMELTLQDYMRAIPGLSDFQVGENGASRMAATAVAAVEGSTTLRAQDKVQEVERGASDTGQILLELCQQFLDTDRAVRISGPGGAGWLNVKPSDIYGEFSVRTEGGSTKAVNPATLAQRGQTIANVVIPTLMNVAGQTALFPAVRQMLRDLGLDADHLMAGLLNPEPAPEAPAPEQAPEAPPVDPYAGQPQLGPQDLGMSPGLTPESLQALQMLNAQSDALSGENVHPADALAIYGGAPVPAATQGDIAL